MAKHGESLKDQIVEVTDSDGKKVRKRIVELPVDPPNTVRRYLVDADIDEDDVPIGARLLDERETEGHLARASRPDPIRVGDLVRRKIPSGEKHTLETSVKGTVDAKLKQNRFRVRFDDGKVERLKGEELQIVW